MKLKNQLEKIDSKKAVFAAAGILIFAILTTSLYLNTETDVLSGEDETQVVATFYPFYDIGTNIGEDTANFETLVPKGTDPHDFDPSPSDIQELENADIFLVTGAEFEEWEKDLKDQVGNDTEIVDPSDRIDLIHADETPDAHGHEHEHEHDEHENETHEHEEDHHHEEEHDEHNGHHHEDDHDHSHGQYDPHYWLSPQNAIIIAEEINQALQEADEENEETYQENKEEYISELEDLDAQYEENLSECNQDTILITHPAFAYLGQDYGFEQVPIQGIGHLTEPSPQELQNLTTAAEDNDLDYIFYDPITEATAAETIADEIDADTLPLHSIEAVENPDQENFLTLMEENLENLETALDCQ